VIAQQVSLGDGRVYRGWETIDDPLAEVYDAVGTIQMTVDSVTVLTRGEDVALARRLPKPSVSLHGGNT
jgi:hypothetical protein